MRILIWKQFASNHSNSFTVVGTFESNAAAMIAAAKLREMLTVIAQYREGSHYTDDLTWPELEFSKQYNVTWSSKSLDWLYADKEMSEYIRIYERQVFVSNGSIDTYLGAKPIDTLLTSFGGQVVVAEEMPDTSIAIDLTCTAPDISTAEQIVKTANLHFLEPESSQIERIPWLIYHSGQKDPKADELLRLQDIHMVHEKAEMEFRVKHRALQNATGNETAKKLRGETPDFSYYHKYNALHEQMLRTLPPFTPDEKWRFHIVYYDTCADGGYAHDNEREITFEKVRFHQPGRALPAVIAYLSDLGCTNITYQISGLSSQEVES